MTSSVVCVMLLTMGLARICGGVIFAYFALTVILAQREGDFAFINSAMGYWWLLEIIGFVAVPGLMFIHGAQKKNVTMSDPALKTSAGKAGSGACSGDSGGPIFGADSSVVALTVWAEGAGKAGCGALTQGLLIAPQRGWIDGVMKSWGQ